MFTERSATQKMFYVGSKQYESQKICRGDSVTLKLNDEFVLVRNIRLIDPHGLKGEISGFEPSHAEEFAGLKVGQIIEFREAQVFSWSHGNSRKA